VHSCSPGGTETVKNTSGLAYASKRPVKHKKTRSGEATLLSLAAFHTYAASDGEDAVQLMWTRMWTCMPSALFFFPPLRGLRSSRFTAWILDPGPGNRSIRPLPVLRGQAAPYIQQDVPTGVSQCYAYTTPSKFQNRGRCGVWTWTGGSSYTDQTA